MYIAKGQVNETKHGSTMQMVELGIAQKGVCIAEMAAEGEGNNYRGSNPQGQVQWSGCESRGLD